MTEESLIDQGWRVEFDERLDYKLCRDVVAYGRRVSMRLYHNLRGSEDWTGYVCLDGIEMRGYLVYTGSLGLIVKDLRNIARNTARSGRVTHTYRADVGPTGRKSLV